MDLAAHALAERTVDELVARHRAQTLERLADDAGGIVGIVVRTHLDLGAGQGRADQFRDLFWIHGAGSYDNPPMSPTEHPSVTDAALLDSARRTFDVERAALERLRGRLDARFAAACRLLLACHGRVVVTGMGKCGHVARKIAATLASTGTPAFFLHPGEASHGDLGMLTRGDVLLALSNSGETAEILTLLPQVRRLGVKVIALTGREAGTLAREADVVLDVGVEQEACPLNLAPTASTTAALAMGDALAVALLAARGLAAEDFARAHPGGNLGRRLLLHVADLMRRGEDLPRVAADTPLAAGLLEMSRKGLGMTAIVDAEDRVLGVFTDGDLRRSLDRPIDLKSARIADLMTRNPRTISDRQLAAEAVEMMERYKVNQIVVVDESDRLAGALNMHDLFQAKVV